MQQNFIESFSKIRYGTSEEIIINTPLILFSFFSRGWALINFSYLQGGRLIE